MDTRVNQSQLPQIRSALKLYKVSSFITGTFLLLLMITWGLRRLEVVSAGAFVGYDIFLFGPNGIASFEPYINDGEGLPATGINLTVAILVVHGWLYVLYLFADFRVWTLLRWSFLRFLIIALGGVVPFLSFITERHYAKIAEDELAKLSQGENHQ
jgi:integral membrane protein